MKKIMVLAAVVACMTTLGVQTAHAQTVALDNAIQRAAAAFAPNIERGSSVAVIAIQAGSAAMSNHIINGMITEFFGMRGEYGFNIASRGHIEMLMSEMELSMTGLVDDASAVSIGRLAGVQYIMTGTFAATGAVYRFWAQLIEVETGFFSGLFNVNVHNDVLVSSLLGAAGRQATRQDVRASREPRVRSNWFSIDASLAGGGLRYEHNLNENFSFGLIVFYNILPFSQSGGGLITTRFYPVSRFYFELGMGLGVVNQWSDGSPISRSDAFGLMVKPAIGFRLGGYQRSFFINPFISVPMAFGGIERRDDHSTNTHTTVNVGTLAQFRAGFGFGWAW